MCQALNLYVSSKEPFFQEECDYMACWGEGEIALFKVAEEPKNKGRKEKKAEWDPLACYHLLITQREKGACCPSMSE